jgi:hypothetical protein
LNGARIATQRFEGGAGEDVYSSSISGHGETFAYSRGGRKAGLISLIHLGLIAASSG